MVTTVPPPATTAGTTMTASDDELSSAVDVVEAHKRLREELSKQ